MEIYKRGQGVWARGFAILIFLLFAGWGAYEVYRFPAELNVLVRPDGVLWRNTVQSLLEAGKTNLLVRGLANQPVNEKLLDPNLQPARRIEDPAGHGIVLPEERFDREKLDAMLKAGITHVPVVRNGQIVDTVPVSEWLVGRVPVEPVRYLETVRFPEAETGKPIGEAVVQKIREDLKGQAGVMVGPLFEDAEKKEQGVPPHGFTPEALTPVMIPAEVLEARIEKVAAPAEAPITREVYETLRRLASEKQLIPPHDPVLRIKDEGALRIEEGGLDDLGGRYLEARRQETVETWWSREMFSLPLVRARIAAGALISLGLFLAGAVAILATWNVRRWNDLLIETQTEMKKVSWPKRDELVGSSLVVIVCVLVLGVYLYVVDILLTTVAVQSGLLK